MPPKRSRTTKSTSDLSKKQKKDEHEWMINDSTKKRVTISQFKGKDYVHIREYYEKDGEFRPGAKGIALNIDEWKQFTTYVNEVNKALGIEDSTSTEDNKSDTSKQSDQPSDSKIKSEERVVESEEENENGKDDTPEE
ncbi:transcription coactivator PC4 [Schizosaccharomyces japonicus yFS275]|uniref:Transcription coactivator PC4 n=1 Tax=Schizosaccharomyces japonicus (strain yFS275 / FY16936) TaxID=402676 RepID=B6JYV1_SCHJY|nr:transcription coactivator PC4 [Schizosaccharomyces japonicus yFS275]EEB06719.1 transcription coactivator PC4 [Schizosaccharomyces japonicus yFS275]